MDTPTPGAAAEARVKRYLTERGYAFEVEPEFGIASHPDYFVTAAGRMVVVEVKAFETFGLFEKMVPGEPDEPGELMSRPLRDALRPIRRQISTAAGQMRDLQDRGWPLVVVLDNPAGRPIPLGAHMVISAMYGDIQLVARPLADGSPGDFQSVAGRNGKLTTDHPYVSAVAVVRHDDHEARWVSEWIDTHRADYGDDFAALTAALALAHEQEAPEGDEIFLEVFETISETAVPMPRDIFNGPRDLRWIPNSDRTGLVPLADVAEG